MISFNANTSPLPSSILLKNLLMSLLALIFGDGETNLLNLVCGLEHHMYQQLFDYVLSWTCLLSYQGSLLAAIPV